MIALDGAVIVVGFGGNVGDDDAITMRFTRAREAIAQLGSVKSAPIYRSAAMGPPQPAYLNSAISVRVTGPAPQPRELSEMLQELEHLLGRDRAREVHWGPRTIDLDVLLWGATPIARAGLVVPHPRLHERRFALRPAAEIVGFDVEVPGTGKSLANFLAATVEQQLELVAQTW
jgi:2-amino-4-hydroxy-6-hydroxymethyldihydropteridine diphosphokinase